MTTMTTTRQAVTTMPSTDILENTDGFHIFMDLPGVAPESLSINLEQNELTIRGESEYAPSRQEQEHCMRAEFEAQIYERVFTLSDMVDRERIKATIKDGVLDLFLPKAETMKPRRIEIKTE